MHARAESYVEALFATPTEQELATAYARIQYEPRCADFKIGEVYFEDADAAVYKVSYTSDGLKQTGLFGQPKTGGPYPLLLLNHGGFSGILKFDLPKIKTFLGHGYAVAMATYRGEGGDAGRAEGALDILGDEMRDILNLMECAAAQERVAPDRIVALGGSHGGGLTLMALTQTGRIRAAAVASAPAGLLNDKIRKIASTWRTQPATVEVSLNLFMTREGIVLMKKILGIKENNPARIPAVRLEIFRRSPVLFAGRISTPLAIYYGGKDPVTSSADGKLIAESLQKRGVPVKLTVYENSGHSYAPDEMKQMDAEILDFFDSYVRAK